LPLAFQTEIKPAHVRAATAGIFWRQVLQPMALGAVAVFWVGAHLTLYVLFARMPWSVHLSLALLFWGSLAAVAQVASQHYQGVAAQNFQRFEGAPARVSLDENAYAYDASWGQGRIEWGRFQSLWRFPTVWVLLQHAQDGASVLLPGESLDEEAKTYLVARLQAVGAKVMR